MAEVEFRGWALMDKPGVELYHLELTVALERDDDIDEWVGEVAELGVTSQGVSVGEAIDNTLEATIVYLDTIEEVGERRRVFTERGIEPKLGPPPAPGERGASGPGSGPLLHAFLVASAGELVSA